VKQYLISQRWWIAGSFFACLAMTCAAKHGSIEYAADHVWEEADRANQASVTIKEPGKDTLN
jgi:hypothetical protein